MNQTLSRATRFHSQLNPMSPTLAFASPRAKYSNKYWSRSASAILPSSRVRQSFSFARMLSRKSPARLLPPGCGREKICAQRGKLGGCSGERFQRRQTHLPRVRDAPVRDPAFDRNRSTEALLRSGRVRTASGPGSPRGQPVGWWMRPDRCAPATENHN